jgi:hypothetical protein
VTAYPYRGPGMLDKPQHYMFSPYGGRDFLAAWRASRQRPGIAPGGSGIGTREVAPAYRAILADGPGRHPIDTLSMLDAMVAAAGRPCAGSQAWLAVFHRKFEVAKRLRAGYSHDLKAVGDHADWRAYPRLGYLLAAGPALEKDVRRLNALLKANDLALSVPEDALDATGKACLSVAVSREIAAVQALCAGLGLDAP